MDPKRTCILRNITKKNIRHWAWKYMKWYPREITTNENQLVCELCHNEYKDNLNVQPSKSWEIIWKSSTHILSDHMERKHRHIFNENLHHQAQIDFENDSLLINSSNNQLNSLVQFIVMDHQAYHVCESKYFRKYVKSISSDA